MVLIMQVVDRTCQKSIDPVTRIPIFNLQGKQIKIEDFKGIDVIFFDLQDVGIRYCGSLGTLMNVMEVAGHVGQNGCCARQTKFAW